MGQGFESLQARQSKQSFFGAVFFVEEIPFKYPGTRITCRAAAWIVYDRFHMQAMYGREVLGAVRLDEARKHKNNAKEILNSVTENDNKDREKEKKADAKAEKQLYSKLKKLR